MVRRIGIVFFGIVALIGVLFAALLTWATSTSGSVYISSELRSTLLEETGLEVSFADIDLKLLPPRIRIAGIEARDEKDRLRCMADEAEFAPQTLLLLTGGFAIEEIYLGGPRCDVRLKSEDIDELEGLLESSDDEGEPFDWSSLPVFGVIALSDGAFDVEIQDPQRLGVLHLSVVGLGLDVTSGETAIEVRGLVEGADVVWSKDEDRIVEDLSDLRVRASVSQNAVEMRQMTASIAGANVSLRGGHIPIPLWPSGPEIDEVSLEVPLELLNRLPLGAPEMFGDLTYLGNFSVRRMKDGAMGVSAVGRLNLDSASAGEFELGGLDGQISLTPYGIAFADTELLTADGRLKVGGNIEFDEEFTTQLTVNMYDIELGHLLAQVTLPDSWIWQRMNGFAKLQGQLFPFRLDGSARIEVTDLKPLLDSYRVPGVESVLHVPKAQISDGKISITDSSFVGRGLNVVTGSTQISVDTSFDFSDATWWLDARSKDFHLSDVGPIMGFEMTGHGPLDCRIEGPLDDPVIRAKGDFEGFSFSDYRFDHAEMKVEYSGSMLSFSDVNARVASSRATVSDLVLDFDTPRGLEVRTKIDASRVLIKDLAKIFSTDLRQWGEPSGFLTGRVSVDYLVDLDRLQIESDVRHENLQILGERFGSDVLRARWDDGALTVTELGLPKGEGIISVTGAMSKEQQLNFVAVASGLTVSAIDSPVLKKQPLESTAQIFAVLEGTIDHPKGWADVSLGLTRYRGRSYGASELSLKLDDDVLDVRGGFGDGLARIEHARLDFGKSVFDVEAFVDDLEVVGLLDVDTGEHDYGLTLTGEVVLFGRLRGKPRLRGHARFDKVRVDADDLSFENEKPLVLRAEEGFDFVVRKTRLRGPDVVFDVSGTLGLERVGIRVRGLVDLERIHSLMSPVEKTKGQLRFEISAKGLWDKPLLLGGAELTGGAIRVAGFPHDIDAIHGQVALSPNLIRFTDFKGTTAEGSLGFNGEMRLKDGELDSYLFRLHARDLELLFIEDLTFAASTTGEGLILKSGKDGGLPILSGDVEVRDLRYTHDIRVLEMSDISVDRLSGAKYRSSKPRIVDEAEDYFRFDVKLHGSRNLLARNNLFDVKVRVDDVQRPLRVVGTNQTFGFLGQILAEKGTVRFAGKRFEVKYGVVEFRDEDRPENPYFRVVADGQVRDWKVTMTVEGTVDEYELKFSSQPYLSKEDIIFVILTGLTRAENRQFGGTGISIGAPILGQLGPSGEAIPVEVQVYNEYSEKAGTDTTRVALGRWVTDDVWVSVSSSLTQERDVAASVDYKISDRVSLSGDYENDNEGQVGNVGVDLKFRLEF